MSAWMLAVLTLLPALALPGVAAWRGELPGRLVAVQLASAVAVLILELMTFAFDQSSFTDLAMTLAVLSLPGTLVMALFIERWL